MSRDWDLVREVLLQVEGTPEVLGVRSIFLEAEDRDQAEVSEQVRFLHEVGLVEAQHLRTAKGILWYPKRLTWKGYEFLAAARDEALWRKAKTIVAERGGNIRMDVLKTILIDLAADQGEPSDY